MVLSGLLIDFELRYARRRGGISSSPPVEEGEEGSHDHAWSFVKATDVPIRKRALVFFGSNENELIYSVFSKS